MRQEEEAYFWRREGLEKAIRAEPSGAPLYDRIAGLSAGLNGPGVGRIGATHGGSVRVSAARALSARTPYAMGRDLLDIHVPHEALPNDLALKSASLLVPLSMDT